MKIAILDCYVDEPSCLGVPPYISFYPRYAAGAILDAGHTPEYFTIDHVRRGEKTKELNSCQALLVISGALVPGKYTRSMPASLKEIIKISEDYNGEKILGGPLARYDKKIEDKLKGHFDLLLKKDLDAGIFDLLDKGKVGDRKRTEEEWKRWSALGAQIVTQHQDHPIPLIAEIEFSRGCPRFITGGCSFCTEPVQGMPVFRGEDYVANEVRLLGENGVRYFRLGGGSCIFSYKALGVGENEILEPNFEAVDSLLKSVRNAVPDLKVLHTDNANPAIVAEHPDVSEKILKSIVKHCTSGNLLSLGMESADPKVIEENNLNAKPEQVKYAIKLINKVGRDTGENGMPRLLPGINLLSGLKGETKSTYEKNFRFLKDILDSNLLLRRINIRQVNPLRGNFNTRKHHREFFRFKKKVREEIDRELLRKMLPVGSVLRDIYIERHDGKNTFGRQIGTYPLLVGFTYSIPTDTFVDAAVVDYGYRSLTAVEQPLDVNTASINALSSLPGIGKKRAARIVMNRPFKTEDEFIKAFADKEAAKNVLGFLKL